MVPIKPSFKDECLFIIHRFFFNVGIFFVILVSQNSGVNSSIVKSSIVNV